jgi:uncharacterized protein (TIRG00374 family)
MSRTRKVTLTVVKIGLAFGLLAYLLLRDKDTLREIHQAMQTAWNHPLFIILSFTATGIAIFCGCVRWNIIMRTQGIDISLKESTQLFLIGQFFNAVMPGAVGGDVVKAVYAAKVTHTKKTEAVTSIVIDRTVGLVSLLILVAVMIGFQYQTYQAGALTAKLLPFLILISLGAIAIVILLFSRNLFKTFPFLERWEKRVRPIAFLRRVYDAFYVCRSHPFVLINAILLSLSAHILTVTAAWLAGCSVQLNITWLDFLTFFPIIAAVQSIPLFPGGVGVREMASAEIFADRGAAKSLSISMSFVYFATLLAWSLVGGVVFMLYTARQGGSIKREWHTLKESSAKQD